MDINLNVKVKGGKRTPVEVSVYSSAANTKTMEFKNKRVVTDEQIAEWIQQNLHVVLKRIQEAEK